MSTPRPPPAGSPCSDLPRFCCARIQPQPELLSLFLPQRQAGVQDELPRPRAAAPVLTASSSVGLLIAATRPGQHASTTSCRAAYWLHVMRRSAGSPVRCSIRSGLGAPARSAAVIAGPPRPGWWSVRGGARGAPRQAASFRIREAPCSGLARRLRRQAGCGCAGLPQGRPGHRWADGRRGRHPRSPCWRLLRPAAAVPDVNAVILAGARLGGSITDRSFMHHPGGFSRASWLGGLAWMFQREDDAR